MKLKTKLGLFLFALSFGAASVSAMPAASTTYCKQVCNQLYKQCIAEGTPRAVCSRELNECINEMCDGRY